MTEENVNPEETPEETLEETPLDLGETATCANCGYTIKGDEITCKNCGYPIEVIE